MRRGAKVRRNVARAVVLALLAPTVALLAAAPAGAVTNPPPFLRKWGSLGTGPTQFDSPSGVAIGPDDSVYTIDSVNNRVQQFTPEGVFVRQWDGRGPARVKFDRPEGITVDGDDNVFVSDHKDRILMFTAEGEFIKRIVQRFNVETGRALHIWGVPGAGNGQFNAPRGIALDGDDHVLVADTGNHRVQVFGPVPQPDGRIRVGTSGEFVGDNVHNPTGRRQTVAATAAVGATATYDVSVQNDGVFAERLRLRGGGSRGGFQVRYSLDGADVTAAVVAGTQQTAVLAPAEAVTVRVTVNVRPSAPVGSSLGATLDATSTLDPTRRDVVRFITSRA